MTISAKLPDTIAVKLPKTVGKAPINYGEGEGADTLPVELGHIPKEIIGHLVAFGLQKTVIDGVSQKLVRLSEDGTFITPHIVREHVQGVVDRLMSGVWRERAGGGASRALDDRTIWLRSQAQLEARKQIQRGSVKVNGQVVTKLEPKLVTQVRDKVLSNEKWLTKMLPQYQPPAEDDLNLDLTDNDEEMEQAA